MSPLEEMNSRGEERIDCAEGAGLAGLSMRRGVAAATGVRHSQGKEGRAAAVRTKSPYRRTPRWTTRLAAAQVIRLQTIISAVFVNCSKGTWYGSRVVVPDGPLKTHFVIIF